MPIRLNGSTAGYTEIDAPAVAGNNTLVLPTTNGVANQLLKNGSTPGVLEYSLTTLDSSGNLGSIASINGGPLAGFRNRIINGDFDIWQRGTSFTANDYGADRWVNNRIGTTATHSLQTFTLGQTAVPNEPTYFCRTVVSSVAGAGNLSILLQKIEDVRTFAGQQVTISFWAKVDATKNIAVEMTQFFGTGGSPSAEVKAIGTTKVSIGTSWQKVTVTATVPSISGKTLGTGNNSSLTAVIWFDAGSDFNSRTDSLGQQSGTFDIAQVQIEPGPVATPFEQRPIGTELGLCQRYYLRVGYAGGGYTSSNELYISPEGIENLRPGTPTWIPQVTGGSATYAAQWFNGSVWTSATSGLTFALFASAFGNRLIRVAGLTGNGSLSTPSSMIIYGYLSAEL